MLFSNQKYWYFSYFSMKTYVVLIRSVSLRHFYWVPATYVFLQRNKKKYIWYPLLSRPMKITFCPISVRHSDTKSLELTSKWNSLPQLFIHAFNNWNRKKTTRSVTKQCLLLINTYIATDKALFSSEKYWYLSYFFTETYVVGTH